ncbi:ABC transporter substrate-binding protein [Bosea sp. NBC_00550]|uniref:ABC transporter substrate-binding protein n=1 Tax=Bosea sp. NBC_00550 TaxID=2969621 RepID=UPI002231DFA8|nr:ABC transporter substrate-binding protein [Bosea sp. NBC_00550]UZF95849.1 ABC transporter substrate-binding protein [Bosea sp. NBC_00550]
MSFTRFLKVASLAVGLIGASAASAQTLNMGVRAGPESMDPHYSALGVHVEALKHIFDTLVRSNEKLQVEPNLAESWKAIDATTWEFKLRKGVKFHDGSDFTAEDVKFSIERIPNVTGPNPATLYTRRIKEVRVIDSHTVHLLTDSAAPTLPNDLVRLFIVSSKAAAGLTRETSNEAFNSGKAAIGTGPYKLVSWTPKADLTLDRFDGYWAGPQPWQRVIRKEISNDAARVAQLRARQVDMISRVSATDVAALQKDSKLNVPTQDTIFVFLLDFDLREKTPQVSAKDGSPLAANPFRDPRVREALDLAIDRRQLGDIAMDGMGSPATQLVSQGIFGFNPEIPEVKADLARSRQLLAEAGYPNGFKFTLSFTVDRLPGDREIGTTLVQMLARVGVDVQANGVPVSILFSARPRGELSATMAGWGTITGEAYYTLSAIAHSNDADRKLGQFNWRGYANPAVDKLIDSAGSELDNAKRSAMLSEAGALFMKDRVTLPLTVIKYGWAVWRDRAQTVRLRSDEETLAMDVVPVKAN